MFSRHERGIDVVVRDDEGRVETMVTVTAIDGDEAQASEIAELVREHYQTSDDVFDVTDEGVTLRDGESTDGEGDVRPVPPGVDDPAEADR